MDTKERKPVQRQRRPGAAGRPGASGKTAVKKHAGAARSAKPEQARKNTHSPKSGKSAAAATRKAASQKLPVRKQRQDSVKEQKPAGSRPRQKTEHKPSIAQEVVYLPPKPFSRNRLLLRLATVVAVVLAFVLGISVFFKVETVMVHGTNQYSANDILKASGIRIGDNLLTFSRAKAGGKIIGTLPYVEKVRFGIKLPGTVNIEITEVEVGYAVADAHGDWWLISSEGKVLEKLEPGANGAYTNLIGVKLDAPAVGAQARALEEQQPETDEAGNTIPVTVTAQKRLNTALNITQYLEQNGIIGEATGLDVTELGDIRLQYGQKYRVELGDDSQLGYKVSILKAALADVMKNYPYTTGSLSIADPQNITYIRDKN